jgi:hypothetical protein
MNKSPRCSAARPSPSCAKVERTVDLVMRLPETWRNSPEKLGDVLIETDTGQRVPLRLVADVREAKGPNVINRENGPAPHRHRRQHRPSVTSNPSSCNQWEQP